MLLSPIGEPAGWRERAALVGNCGSPLETDAGWLVLTHGVGPMRQYAIAALLLDLHHPERVVGELSGVILAPHETDREGYVPNVVYSVPLATLINAMYQGR